jgi:hypothetical protein
VRLASNSLTLFQFVDGWRDEHALSQPLTGALFDIFVAMFQENLVKRGLIARRTADMTEAIRIHPEHWSQIQSAYDDAYCGQENGFREALIEAREYSGKMLADAWKRASPDFLTYADYAKLLLTVDRELSRGEFEKEMIESFVWRGIGEVSVGPKLSSPGSHSHAYSRTLLPDTKPASRAKMAMTRWN